jgi:hypothetical protein
MLAIEFFVTPKTKIIAPIIARGYEEVDGLPKKGKLSIEYRRT